MSISYTKNNCVKIFVILHKYFFDIIKFPFRNHFFVNCLANLPQNFFKNGFCLVIFPTLDISDHLVVSYLRLDTKYSPFGPDKVDQNVQVLYYPVKIETDSSFYNYTMNLESSANSKLTQRMERRI